MADDPAFAEEIRQKTRERNRKDYERKKERRRELFQKAESDPETAAKVAEYRAYMVQAQKRYRNKLYSQAETGSPEAVARYEHFLQVRRDAYHQRGEEG